jgi:hypothetical protein
MSADYTAFMPAVRQALELESAALIAEHADVVAEEAVFSAEQDFIANFTEGSTEDVVELDVSGEHMAVKRSTLRLCEESALARRFDDSVWTEQSGKGSDGSGSDSEDDGRVPIDQSAYCFGKIVDQLRTIATTREGVDAPVPAPEIVAHERQNFARVVKYFFPECEAFITRAKVEGVGGGAVKM